MVDRPALQYVVEEAVAAGLGELCLVSGPGKEAVQAHFAPNEALEAALEASGNAQGLAKARAVTELAKVSTVLQESPKGLGDAVARGRDFAEGEPVAVLLGDDFLDADTPALAQMVDLNERTGASVLLLVEVPQEATSMYGIAAVEPADELAAAGAPAWASRVVRVTALQEKPAPEQALSRLAIIGRYVLSNAVFEVLAHTPPGRGGEIQLTDALQTLVGMDPADGGGVLGIVFTGDRYDTGDKLGLLKATVSLAAKHPELGPDFATWLRGFVAQGENA